MKSFRWFLILLIAVGAVACTSKPQPKTLNLAIWSNYLAPEVIERFENETGIHVSISNYSSNEELLAKLQAGASGFDVAIPSDYMVFAMIQLGLLEKLDRSKLPGLVHLDSKFLGKPYDSGNVYSLPYNWGTTGIAYDREKLKKPITDWKDLFSFPELKGQYTLLDDAREALGAALKSQGFKLCSRDPAELKKARDILIVQRSRVKAFNSETKVPLINGEVWAAQAYSSDALQAALATHHRIEYVIPAEGGTLWIDNLVIPKGAPHLSAAHAFIDFILKPESAVSTVGQFLATANRDALKLVAPALLQNVGLFPPPQILGKLEMMEDLGESVTLYDRLWTEVKASNR